MRSGGEAAVRGSFRHQASSCLDLGSPFTARLLRLLAERLRTDRPTEAAILNWPSDPASDALALRLAGALHALVLTRRSPELIDVYPPKTTANDDGLWRALETAFDQHGESILRFIDGPPQTNEVARSAALAGGFHVVAALTAAPLAILELGASAGLNLHWNRFGYDLGGLTIRRTTGRPLIVPDWRGPTPPRVAARVLERAGCDRSPIDVRSSDDVLKLRAYIWPDQLDRLARLNQALEVARASTLVVEQDDAVQWAEKHLSKPRYGMATVLYHSIFWQYLPFEHQQHLQRIIDGAGRSASSEAPLAWLRMEPESRKAASLRLTQWPDRRNFHLADVDYHGRWVNWHVDERDLPAAPTPAIGLSRKR